jgi:hypothetical protein
MKRVEVLFLALIAVIAMVAPAYLFVGPAYATHLTSNTATGIARNGRDPQDVQTVAARVRYSF